MGRIEGWADPAGFDLGFDEQVMGAPFSGQGVQVDVLAVELIQADRGNELLPPAGDRVRSDRRWEKSLAGQSQYDPA